MAIAFDENRRAYISSSEELKKVFRQLFRERDLSETEIATVREKLSAWAKSIPHHDIIQFGKCVEIEKATVYPYYHFTLRTQYESRAIERRQEPYRGARIPPLATDEGNINIWNYPPALIDDFTPASREFKVDDSQEVRECARCEGTGKTQCKSCTGKGRVRCDTCRGAGTVTCRTCHGGGQVEKIRQEVRFRSHTEYRTVTKYREQYTSEQRRRGPEPYTVQEPYKTQEQYTVDVPYQERCPTCDSHGKVTCISCQGNQAVTCGTCTGAGELTCHDCDGKRRVVSYLVLHDIFEPVEDSRLHPNSGVAKDLSNMLEMMDGARIPPLWITHSEFQTSITDLLENPTLRGAIANAITSSKSPTGPAKRITKQSLKVRRDDVILVRYAYEGSSYELFLCGRNYQIHATHSPMSKAAEDALDRARAHLDTDEIDKGLQELKRGFEMGQRDGKARATLEALRIKLSEAYVAEAVNVSEGWLWPESLYYSDRAKSLVSKSPPAVGHEAKMRKRIALLHLGPPLLICATATVLAATTQRPLMLLPAIAAIVTGATCQAKIGSRIRGVHHALMHSTALCVVLTLGTGMMLIPHAWIVAVPILCAVVIGDIFLFKALRTELLRDDSPADIASDPGEAIRQISEMISADWEDIGGHFRSLKPLSAFEHCAPESAKEGSEAYAEAAFPHHRFTRAK